MKRFRYIRSSEIIDDEIDEIGQEYTSRDTSINKTKLPAIFKLVSFQPGTINLDYGGGKFDNATEYLDELDVTNLIYDPYNRSSEHNREVIKQIKQAGGADTATCSNVLNVIKEQDVRLNVLSNIKKLLKPNGTVYITVYEGSGDSKDKPTKSGYQLNRKTADYLDEIYQIFPDAKRRGKLIVAHPKSSIQSVSDPWGLSYDNWLADEPQSKIDSFSTEAELEVDVAFDIEILPDGSYEFLDNTFSWARDLYYTDDSEYIENVPVCDRFYFIDIVDGILYERYPKEPGKYHISANITLVFDIDNIERLFDYSEFERDHTYDGDPDCDVFYDNMEVDFIWDKSKINSCTVTEI